MMSKKVKQKKGVNIPRKHRHHFYCYSFTTVITKHFDCPKNFIFYINEIKIQYTLLMQLQVVNRVTSICFHSSLFFKYLCKVINTNPGHPNEIIYYNL